ncbi:uncharacterized protein LOC126672900 [Mercurialis annua]|uniref:uncharacterized protein LOC126672900 n=1 Tax=Mercurialis annua TaxID=3986 RepID=UPI00215DE9BF|nr:uncharacterized protein LOC126672900 [Mercurialis annua]
MWKNKFSHEPTPIAHKPAKFQNSGTNKKVPTCNNSARDNLKKEILKGLRMVLQETNNIPTACDPVRVAASLESELFLKWGVLSNGNRNKYNSVLSKLKDRRNSDFRTRILMGEISPEKVVFLSTLEIASDLMKARDRAQVMKGREEKGRQKREVKASVSERRGLPALTQPVMAGRLEALATPCLWCCCFCHAFPTHSLWGPSINNHLS